jgi:hypothetical protein
MFSLFKLDETTGVITVNGEFTTEHFGEHTFTVIAADHGDPPLETTSKLVIRIDGSFYTQPVTTTNAPEDYEETAEESSTGSVFFSRATLPPQYGTTGLVL